MEVCTTLSDFAGVGAEAARARGWREAASGAGLVRAAEAQVARQRQRRQLPAVQEDARSHHATQARAGAGASDAILCRNLACNLLIIELSFSYFKAVIRKRLQEQKADPKAVSCLALYQSNLHRNFSPVECTCTMLFTSVRFTH